MIHSLTPTPRSIATYGGILAFGVAASVQPPQDIAGLGLRLFMIVTVVGLGVALVGCRVLSRLPIDVTIWVWMVSASAVLLIDAEYLHPQVKPGSWLPSIALTVDSVSAVLVFAVLGSAVVRGIRLACDRGSERIQRTIALGLCLGYVWWIWNFQYALELYHLPWSNQIDAPTRSRLVLDMINALWWGVIIPASTLRHSKMLWPLQRRTTSNECLPGVWSRVAIIMWAVVLVGVVIEAWRGNCSLESLPAVWWWRKVLMVFLWTAVYEEIAWRVVLFSGLRAAIQPAGSAALLSIIAVSALAFGAMHLSRGLITASYAVVIGLLFGHVIVSRGSAWPAIVTHLALDLYCSTWELG